MKNFYLLEIGCSKLLNAGLSILNRSFLGFALLVVVTFSLPNNSVFAQTPCKTGCTSNDVQIKSAFLMQDRNGTALQSCASGSPVQAYLYLELITNTPRVGVS